MDVKEFISKYRRKLIYIGIFLVCLVWCVRQVENTGNASDGNKPNPYSGSGGFTHSCDYCGRSYSGKGYTHLLDGCYQPEEDRVINYSCSMKCCMESWNASHRR